MPRDLVVNVAELLRQPARRRRVDLVVPVEAVATDGIRVVDVRVPEGAEVAVAVELESVADGIVATGRVAAPWEAECRRCLATVHGRVEADLRELFRAGADADGEAFPIEGEQLDLAPPVRLALTLDLPLAPVCRDACAGLCPECGADLNEGPCIRHAARVDPRWEALEALRDQLEDRS